MTCEIPLLRNKDNYNGSYDYIKNQLGNYNFNDQISLNNLKLKLNSLDGPILNFESGGGSLLPNTTYYPGQYIVIAYNGSPTKFRCNTEHISGLRNLRRLGSIKPWKPNTNYKSIGTLATQIYNGGEWLNINKTVGDIISYQNKIFKPLNDFTSGSYFDDSLFFNIPVNDCGVSIEASAGTGFSFPSGSFLNVNGIIYECLDDYLPTEPFLEMPCFYPDLWDLIGPVSLSEFSILNPLNHYDALMNDLRMLDLYVRTVEDLLCIGEIPFADELLNRQVLLQEFPNQINPLTGLNYEEWELPISSRPPLLSVEEMDDLYNTVIKPKITNNEIGSVLDLINKIGGTGSNLSKMIAGAESSLAGLIPPDEAESGLRDSSIEVRNEIRSQIQEYERTYDEIHNLVYSIFNLNGELPARPWRPDFQYNYGDAVLAPDNQGELLQEGFIPEISTTIYNSSVESEHMWFCKTPHITSLDFPNFDYTTKKYEGYIREGIVTSYEYFCNDCRIPAVLNVCPSCGGIILPGELKTIWVRPNWIKDVDEPFIEYPSTYVPPDPDPYEGWPILSIYHRSPATGGTQEEQDLEAECGIHKLEYDYSNIIIKDIDGDDFPVKIANYKGWIFKVDGLITLENPIPIVVDPLLPPPDPFIWGKKELMEVADSYLLTFIGFEGILPKTEKFGLAFVTQRTIIPPQNTCCTGGAPAGINKGETVQSGPERQSYEVYQCQDCCYEMYKWAADRNICPMCLGNNIQFLKFEVGAVKTPQTCGYQIPWAKNMKHHTIFSDNLSPTNGKRLNMGDNYCDPCGNGYSDCQPCRGCWSFEPESMNYPLDLKYMKTFRKRDWINWAYIDNCWLCSYINDITLIWPGDKRYPLPDPPEPCSELAFFPPMICDTGWPNNWKNAVEALSGDWPDKYAIPAGSVPGLGFIPRMSCPDGHTINAYGQYYGTPEEDWAQFCFCYYVDNGIFEQTTSIEILRDRNDLPDGGNQYGDITMQRFAILNNRIKVIKMNIENLIISIGNSQISNILEDVQIPNIKPDMEQQLADLIKQKNQNIYSAQEIFPEFN